MTLAYRLRNIALAVAVALLVACLANAAEAPSPPRLSSPELAGHPLTGRIWRASDGAFITPDMLAEALIQADYVLVGETHDNPDHHRIEAWTAAALFANGRRPGLALEMIRTDLQKTVSAYLAKRPDKVSELGKVLEWTRSGWPAWSFYAPTVAPFAREGLPVIGADLSRTALLDVLKGGVDALPLGRRRALGLNQAVPAPMLSAMAKEIVQAHCGVIGADHARPFARAQFARDAALADGLRRAAAGSTQGAAMLIAGAGHVRTDRGVPWHLRNMDRTGKTTIVSLAAVEVSKGVVKPTDYGQEFGTDRPPFDYVWFTGHQPRGNPCVTIK